MEEDKYRAAGSAELKTQRNSNIELLRILMMLVVIAHHYIVNSGITPLVMTIEGGANV